MARNTIKDMTVGSPMKLVLGFALPLLFGFAFQQLYSFVDTAIVGKVLGAEKLAAVGSTGSVNFLILGMCNGLCAGMSIPIAQAFGAKDETDLRRHMANAIYVGAVFSVLLAVATALLCPAILRLMDTDETIIGDAIAYIRIIFIAIPVTVLYNMAGGILRALGDSRTPVIFLAVASLVNIALDLLFMIVFGMGVQGAAIATAISQLVSGVGCVIVMVRGYPILRLTEDDRRFRPAYARHLLGIGIPMGLQYSITAIGSVIMQWSVNGISVAAVAAMTASAKVHMFFACIFDALATTMATFAGQNVGAKRMDRVGQGLKAAAILGIVYSLLANAVVWLFGRQLIGLFLDAAETQVIDMALINLKIIVAFYVLLLFVNIVRLTIQGMGFTSVAMIAGVMEMVARIGVALLAVPAFGYVGACMGNPAAWVFADAFLFPCYFHVVRQLRKRFRCESAQ